MPIKPKKVLCKRTLTSGKSYWWDDSVNPPVRHEHDNRMLVAGNWYDVVENPNDSWDEEKRKFTFSIIDNQGKLHLHFMYDAEDKLDWPDFCTKYGPRDYAKWFYTPEELELLKEGKFRLDEDINIKPGQYHWVLTKDNNWIIAQCHSKHDIHGQFYWYTMGHIGRLPTSSDFAEIGRQVVSQKEQIEQEKRDKVVDELIDEVCVLVNAINKPDPDENYPSVEYVMPFVNKAFDNYHQNNWDSLADSEFFKETN